MKRLSLLLLFTLLLALPVFEAQAGVLLRSSRVSSRVNARPPRIVLGRSRPSTWVAARLNPINSGSYNGTDVIKDYADAQRKYQIKLYKWHVKQAKRAERKRQKEEKRELELYKKQKRAQEKAKRLAKEQGTASSEDISESSGQSETASGISDSKKPGITVAGKPKRQKTFWARLWQSIIRVK